MKKIVMILWAMFICLGVTGFAGATLLTFDDPSSLGGILGGGMRWSDIGGGHLYCEQYFDDDYLYFSDATYVDTFQMNRLPWEEHWSQDWNPPNIDYLIKIAAFDVDENEAWSEIIDLTDYADWNNWLTVSVRKDNIQYIKFYAVAYTPDNSSPYATDDFYYERPGFWPSIDNMRINETTPIPEPSIILLLGSGLFGLAVLEKKQFFKK